MIAENTGDKDNSVEQERPQITFPLPAHLIPPELTEKTKKRETLISKKEPEYFSTAFHKIASCHVKDTPLRDALKNTFPNTQFNTKGVKETRILPPGSGASNAKKVEGSRKDSETRILPPGSKTSPAPETAKPTSEANNSDKTTTGEPSKVQGIKSSKQPSGNTKVLPPGYRKERHTSTESSPDDDDTKDDVEDDGLSLSQVVASIGTTSTSRIRAAFGETSTPITPTRKSKSKGKGKANEKETESESEEMRVSCGNEEEVFLNTSKIGEKKSRQSMSEDGNIAPPKMGSLSMRKTQVCIFRALFYPHLNVSLVVAHLTFLNRATIDFEISYHKRRKKK